MWPFTRQHPSAVAVSVQQRNEIMGRIHASNVASLADMHITLRGDADRKRALERVKHKLGHDELRVALNKQRARMGYAPEDASARVLKNIIGMLERADLTINVRPMSWFLDESRLNATGPESFWSHVDQKKGYALKREQVENELFMYDGALVPNTNHYTKVADGVKKHASPALKDGKVTNPDFSAASRPIYAALNWLSVPRGGAAKFGHAYFVLNSYLKHKTTFIHEDTFKDGVANPANLANHFNYYPLVCNVNERVLDAMISPLSPTSIAVAEKEYIDAQIHAPVLFKRDVKAAYFCKADFIASKNIGADQALFDRVKPKFERFCKLNGIKFHYI